MAKTQKALRKSKWKYLDVDKLPLQFSIADSVLKEFVQSHSPSAVLTELVQNEYDAQGTRLEILFGDESVIITGNGKPVDNTGWRRLSVMLGTGTVAGSDRTIAAKANSIGSKNFGLRSLFIYGGRIHIRSGGYQTILDISKGTLSKPLRERASRNRPGIHIEVPYRTDNKGDLGAFGAEKEAQAFDRFAKDIMPMLIKLANSSQKKSLKELVVSSKRCNRRISWQQSVETIPSLNKRVKALHRTITMKDTRKLEKSPKHIQKMDEVEFQKSFCVPDRFKQQNIPDYFRLPGGRIRMALSVRIKRGKMDSSEPGLLYYPLGLLHALTGTGISINAPFQLHNDRTRIIEPENSPWNGWLLEEAADLTVELLVSDWLEKFGGSIYLALDETSRPSITHYLDRLNDHLRNRDCWPTRACPRGRVEFACANNIVIPADEGLNGFLSDNRCLDERLDSIPDVRSMAQRYGAKKFTVNSLVRLRCFGKDKSSMQTKLGNEEADFHWTAFPDVLKDEKRQVKFAIALDSHSRRLSEENRIDLSNSPTTLAADNNLQSPSSSLWVVDSTIAEVCPVPPAQRLHPSLMNSKIITRLCTKFDSSAWVRSTAGKIQANQATKEEQEALYGYLLSAHGHLSRNIRTLLRRLPVLRDHKRAWVAPCQITAEKSTAAKRLEAVLHFPNRDYVEDIALARALRFKQRIEGKDIIDYAQLVKDNPELSDNFEQALQQLSNLLTRPLAKQLSQVPFLRDSLGGISAPTGTYIRNRLNKLCIGDDAPFVHGNRVSLYRQLGCREEPKAHDIVEHLRKQNAKLEQPEVIYAALASALRRESLPSNHFSKEPIIWNGGGYSSPENTLLGSKHRDIFLDAVPCISVKSRKLRELYSSLGVCFKPQEWHWKQLLVWFGQRYEDSGNCLSGNERKVIRKAYRELRDIPKDLPDNTKYLLDRQGKLHDMSDVDKRRFIIDDNPRIAQAVLGQGIPLSIADTSEHGTLAFFRTAGVKSLTEVQQRQGIKIGEFTDAPKWYNQSVESNILKRVHSPEFSSALTALKESDSRESSGNIPTGTTAFHPKLSKIQQILFAREISGLYKIGNYEISILDNFALGEDSITILKVRSKSELFGLVAQVIANMLVADVTLQRNFSDAIYRLLTCRSVSEMEKYLNDRGIPWHPSTKALEELEEKEDEDEDETEYGLVKDDIGNILANLFKQPVGTSKNGDKVGGPSKPPPKGPTTTPPPHAAMPSFESIEVIQRKPSNTWTPSQPKGGGGGGGGPRYWAPPGPSDEEWARKVGRRGEEIIYEQELNRVRNMGYPESKVVWEADQNPSADFDIRSIDDDGEDIWIEVKSTTGRDGRFRWPKAEFEKALEKRSNYILWRVYEADTAKPSVKPFKDPVGIMIRKGMYLDIDTFNAVVEPKET